MPNASTLKLMVKSLLRRVSPSLAEQIHTVRQRRHIRRFERRMGIDRVTDAFLKRHGQIIQSGPFAGLKYIDCASGSSLLPKLVGSYERELWPAIERIVKTPYKVIAEVGCAEGYYAVGLAHRMPTTVVYAYDIDDEARRRCNELARLNGVSDRVIVRGRCDKNELNNVLSAPSLVVCDCEGFEDELIDPVASPSVVNSDVLVELHDGIQPGVTQRILERLRSTHDCKIFEIIPRNTSNYSCLADLSETDSALAVNEFRGFAQQWIFATVR